MRLPCHPSAALVAITVTALTAAPCGAQSNEPAPASADTPARVDPSLPTSLWRPEAERYRRESVQRICRGAPVPPGWILVDDGRDARRCRGAKREVVRGENVWTIERYADRPVNTTMEVCATAPTPEGWVLVDIFRAKERCGRPVNPFSVNVKRIRRAQ